MELKLTVNAEVIREKVQDGLTGETKDMVYTQCKIVGNGSFGVVFQTKLSPNGEDAAIKRVLQDKRFKVRASARSFSAQVRNLTVCRIASCKSCASLDTRTSSSLKLFTTPTERGCVSSEQATECLILCADIGTSTER